MTSENPVVAAETSDGAGKKSEVLAFSFGDAEGVLDRREFLNYMECWRNGLWYEPPVPMNGLARALNVSSHHRSAISVKINLLLKTFLPSRWLDRATFRRWALDYLVMGNGYLQRIDNMLGKPMRLDHALALYTRRGVDDGRFFFLQNNNRYDPYEFTPNTIFQLAEPDVSQEIYGMPEYLSALQSAFLNEASTLFRRRYYINGAHAGFILYLSETAVEDVDIDALREQLRGAKGVGNFKNLFLHIPGGKKDGVQLIPVGAVGASDEFLGIKNTTRDDILAAHRVPPQLIGVVPANTGGFGDVEKAESVFVRMEIEPLQTRFLELNDWLGVEAVAFQPYELPQATPPAA